MSSNIKLIVFTVTEELYVLLLMLFTDSSFARHDDVWVWRSNSTHSQV